MFMKKGLLTATAVTLMLGFASLVNAETLYVNAATGSNGNDGSKSAPFKNIQKAINVASSDATILVAEGNYTGLLNVGYIVVKQPVTIKGGYSSDFSQRDVLKYKTTIRPNCEANGKMKGKGNIQISGIQAPNGKVVIDGLILDRGNSISYNKKGEGKPEGVESPMMNPIGVEGIGGEALNERAFTQELAMIYMGNANGSYSNTNVEIRNCAFINAPDYGILGNLKMGSLLVDNCIFVNNRLASIEVRGGDANTMTQITVKNCTMLFNWSTKKDMSSMGYGFRFQPGTSCTLQNNIIGLSCFTGLCRGHIDSNKAREAKRKDIVENNIFFLNKVGDLSIPGGGMMTNVGVGDFGDVEVLTKATGNKALTDPSAFKGKINNAYLNGFLNVSYKETVNYDENSAANQFRSAMGLNKQGTINSSASMYANRYPWKEALKLFGAMANYGAQNPK